jgi:acylphosphatase
MDTAAVSLVIEGMVQGVFFRAAAQTEAKRLGLSGWIRNLPDGRVQAHAEGVRARVEEFVAWCHHGPSGSVVTWVQVQWVDPTGDAGGFRVTR